MPTPRWPILRWDFLIPACGLFGLLGCDQGPVNLRLGATSSSIVFIPAGGKGPSSDLLAVTDPDSGGVSFLDAATLKPLGRVQVGGEPHQLLLSRDGTLRVTCYQSNELVTVQPGTMTIVERMPICAGPWGMALAVDGSKLAIACERQSTVDILRDDLQPKLPFASLHGLLRPRAVTFSANSVLVAADFVGGRVLTASWIGDNPKIGLIGDFATADGPSGQAAYHPSQSAALLSLTDGNVVLALQEVANGEPKHADIVTNYGALAGGVAKILPILAPIVLATNGSAVFLRPASYGGNDAATASFNSPSALTELGNDRVAVAHLSSNDVAIVDISNFAEPRHLASFHTGAGPRGLAFDPQTHRLYVDNALDGSVSLVDLAAAKLDAAPPARASATVSALRPLPPSVSAEAWQGRRIFHDSTNKHMTPQGIIACSTCHPDGGDDGLTWFLSSGTEGKRVRRSMPLGGFRFTSPHLHWSGEFSDLNALVQSTVTQVMGGDGLLIDHHALMTYLTEMVQLPLPPTQDAAAVDRGRSLFESPQSGCATCHSGPNYTDGQLHTVLKQGILPEQTPLNARTPSLIGVFLRAPYFHDGRSPDLVDLHTRADLQGHGNVTKLSPQQLGELIVFIKSL